MIKKLKAFLAVAALSGTVGANVHAEEITVKEGDTLWDLSQVHNTSVEDIQNWNHLSTNLIHPGDVLTIATEKQYTVQQDDTLGEIALNYQVQVNQIKDWNKLLHWSEEISTCRKYHKLPLFLFFAYYEINLCHIEKNQNYLYS